jgi:hypothetical protein
MRQRLDKSSLAIVAGACILLVTQNWSILYGQVPTTTVNVEPANAAEEVELLSPNQVDDLVAPIALYPDPLIGQILVATTYPIEVLPKHSRGTQLQSGSIMAQGRIRKTQKISHPRSGDRM